MWYKMVGDDVVQIDVEEFSQLFPKIEQRKIGDYQTSINGEHCEVSTVFLGMDHGVGEPRPVLFESAIFYKGAWIVLDRYCTKSEALVGHNLLVSKMNLVEKGLMPIDSITEEID